MLTALILWLTPPVSAQETPAEDAPAVLRSERVEFDERTVSGQTASSGAVYLFKRTPRDLPALVPLRESYRERIVAPVLGDRPLEPVQAEPAEGEAP